MRKFLKKFCSGPFCFSVLFAGIYWTALALIHYFNPDLSSDYGVFPDRSNSFHFLFGASTVSLVTILCCIILLLFDYLLFRLQAKNACRPLVYDIPICTYVDSDVYHRFFVICGQTGIPFEKFCQLVLECFDPVKIDSIVEAYQREV